jgi:hypothetical protein
VARVSEQPKVRPLAAGLPFILFGVVVVLIALLVVKRGEANRSWQFVPGEIIEAGHRVVVDRGAKRSKSAPAYYPSWVYEYTVDGERFTSHRIREGEPDYGYNTPEAADRAASARFPVGTPVTVFYDPANPASARLYQGVAVGGVSMIFGGGRGADGGRAGDHLPAAPAPRETRVASVSRSLLQDVGADHQPVEAAGVEGLQGVVHGVRERPSRPRQGHVGEERHSRARLEAGG